ncbi:hypothetical protein AOLI_G00028160 [Acnodon oligacanthus]
MIHCHRGIRGSSAREFSLTADEQRSCSHVQEKVSLPLVRFSYSLSIQYPERREIRTKRDRRSVTRVKHPHTH